MSNFNENVFQFYFGLNSPEQFESHIYSRGDLEELLGADLYLKIISANYLDQKEVSDLKQVLSKAYSQIFGSNLYRDYAKFIAELSLSGDMTLNEACKRLSDVSLVSDDIDAVFSGYDDELSENPDSLDFYKSRITADLESLI